MLPAAIPSGQWETDGGSILQLVAHDDGRVTGAYATVHGQPQPGQLFPLIGFHNHHLIGFTVSWGPHRSITSWCGRLHMDQGRLCLKTVWHLGREFADRAHEQINEHWESFVTFTGTYYHRA